MKKNTIQRWRLNVLIIYDDQMAVNHFRDYVLHVLQHLSSIYKLDYAISYDHPFFDVADPTIQSADKSIVDLVYFRSNQNSRISRKDFRSTIDCMFGKVPSPFVEGVEVDTQLYKALPEYPFPDEYYSPLSYPYVEFHKGGQTSLYIWPSAVLTVIQKEQDFPMN